MRAPYVFVLLVASLCGCTSARPSRQEGLAYFRVKVDDERFVVAITDATTIRGALENIAGRNTLHPTGAVVLGDGGINRGYRWHLAPESVRLTALSGELCNGLPSDVEKSPERWIREIRYYCPRTGRFVEQLPGQPAVN